MMMDTDKVPSIVQGEASESDSDDDKPTMKCVGEAVCESPVPHGIVVVGEAPESDEERAPPVVEVVQEKQRVRVRDSLLHKKLSECNASLHNNLVGLLKTTVEESLAQLTSAEQQLIKSQMRIQRASASVRSLAASSGLLANKLSSTASSSHIPHINIALPQPNT